MGRNVRLQIRNVGVLRNGQLSRCEFCRSSQQNVADIELLGKSISALEIKVSVCLPLQRRSLVCAQENGGGQQTSHEKKPLISSLNKDKLTVSRQYY